MVERDWKEGDKVEVDFPMKTTTYHTDERVITNRNQAAVKRGPVVYAAEGVDNDFQIPEAFLVGNFKETKVENVLTNSDTSKDDKYGVKKGLVITADGVVKNAAGEYEEVEWTLIPYYAWNNRGKDIMRVFLKEMAAWEQDMPKVLAKFDFDDEEKGFDDGYAAAKGSYTIQDYESGKAIYLDGKKDFLEVTRTTGDSLLTGVEEMTVSFQAKPDSGSSNWLFYAAPDSQAHQLEYGMM